MSSVISKKPPPQSSRAASPETLNRIPRTLFALKAVKATELILVHDAEPDYRAAVKSKNLVDPPLTERGRWQAMRLAMRLRRLPIDAIYTSNMRRALETAVFIAAARDLPMIRLPQLREININANAFEGAAFDAIGPRQAVVRLWGDPRWGSLPGFEPSYQFRQRVAQAMDGILAHHAGQRVVVVTHAGVINAYLSTLLDIPRDMFFLPEHASLSVVRVLGDQPAVQRLNDSAHLLSTFAPR